MTLPGLWINLKKITDNTRVVKRMLHNMNIPKLTAVTKACCGSSEIGKAMLRGGADMLGDSRISNLKRLRDCGLDTELMLLRSPDPEETDETVKYADVSLNTEISTLCALSESAVKLNKMHSVILMIELGDLREGIMPGELEGFIGQCRNLAGIKIAGFGTNLACFGGVVPTEEKMDLFEKTVTSLNWNSPEILSGGNSANFIMSNWKASVINNLRIGETILLGLETVNRSPLEGLHQDAFMLKTRLIEVKKKPSVPWGQLSQNAYGESPVFRDRGMIKRGILSIGRQDVDVTGLSPTDHNIEILGSSSDHIILDLGNRNYQTGDIISFSVSYSSLVSLFTSSYVEKNYIKTK